ncbi:MAG: hydrogenase formation protein HypD [Candidatus Delongbacteria bacterium]
MSAPAGPFRDPHAVQTVLRALHALPAPPRQLSFMHVCGTHEQALGRWGLRRLLPDWLRLVAGPGCPVCVCPALEIAAAARLCLEGGAWLASFGDMLRVPGAGTLEEARARGGRVQTVLGVSQALELARREPATPVVFFAVGFETTACTTAAALLDSPPDNFSVLCAQRLIPPALGALRARPELNVDGFLLPGHVLAVTGWEDYETCLAGLPAAVAGFEPLDLLLGLHSLALQALERAPRLDNLYPRAVRRVGNPRARAALTRVFQPVDADWRGLGPIPVSGLELRAEFAAWNARERFRPLLENLAGRFPSLDAELPGCRCAEVMVGACDPPDCPLFGGACTPDAPRGACMMGSEGACRVRHTWREV